MLPRKKMHKYESSQQPRDEKQYQQHHIRGDESIRLVATIDCCGLKWYQFFPRHKIKSIWQKLWLSYFRMQSTKKLEVHCNLHIHVNGHNVVTFENVKVCCIVWYTIHGVSKAHFIGFKSLHVLAAILDTMIAMVRRSQDMLYYKQLLRSPLSLCPWSMQCPIQQKHYLPTRKLSKWSCRLAQNGKTY